MDNFLFERIAQTLAANQELKRTIRATEFRLSAALWPVTVYFMQGGRIVGEAAGMLAGDSVKGMEFDAFIVKNGALVQNIVLTVSRGGAGSDRIMGSVEVIDGGKTRVLSGVAYDMQQSRAADVANASYCQIWNPAGSGKVLVVESVTVSVTVAGGVSLLDTAVQLATASGTPANKYVGGAASVMTGKTAAMAAPPAGNYHWAHVIAANAPKEIDTDGPILVPEGFGLVVGTDASNTKIIATWDFYEASAT